MLSERDIVARVQHLTVTRLRVWVRQGWIRPADQDRQAFNDADMARAALIRDLEDKLGFDEEQVPVLLNLIDQIHGLRAELKTMLDAFEVLPDDVRSKVKTRIAKRKPRSRRR
jgi:chaperone modulatory protein CbpM